MMFARLCLLYALMGDSEALRVADHGGTHSVRESDTHFRQGSKMVGRFGKDSVWQSEAHFQQGSGMVGEFGARGFRTLGESCWDSAVWKQVPGHLTRAMCAK